MIENKFVSDEENTFSQPICNNCKHHIDGIECKAFKKIPDSIILDGGQHDKIISGQIGDYIFEKE